MATESEIKLARYNQIEKEADGFGRVIGDRRLKPSEQTRLIGMTNDLTGHEIVPVTDEETKAVSNAEVSHRSPLMLAASVCLINEDPITFPRSRGELDAIFDRLDVEGLTAAAVAMGRLNETELVGSPRDAAKN